VCQGARRLLLAEAERARYEAEVEALLPYNCEYVVPQELVREAHAHARHRNAAIRGRQGNRNPFIDHPELAVRLAWRPPVG
jgi:endonuclease I